MNFTCVNQAMGTMEGFCLLKSAECKTTAKGVPYLDMVIADRGGELNAKFWDYRADAHYDLAPGGIVKIRGILTVYNGSEQFKVERMRPVDEKDDFLLEDIVPSAPESGATYLEELQATVAHFASEDLRKIVQAALAQCQEPLQYWPAAYRLHHAVRGGLLWHTCSVLRLATAACFVYPELRHDLLSAGVILHDLQKIQEFDVSELGIANGYSLQGELIGHLVGGAVWLEELGKELGTPEELLLLLQHMMISHHGKAEYGAAKLPMFLEAEVLSLLDDFDARMFQITGALDMVPPGGFTHKLWALDNRKFYKPNL